MGIFRDKCKECNSKDNIKMCPFCKKYLCSKCLRYLIYKKRAPEWFIGKKVKNLEEYKNLYLEYCKLHREKGHSIHCCDKYLEDAWTEIIKYVREKEETTKIKAAYIILR